MPSVELRQVAEGESELLFQHLRDPAAAHMAAFTVADPADREGFEAAWRRLVADPSAVLLAIVADGILVGHLVLFTTADDTELSYWIDRDHWGRGIATEAVRSAVAMVGHRATHAKVAADNLPSRRVLAKAGFVEVGRNTAPAPARGEDLTEIIVARPASAAVPGEPGWPPDPGPPPRHHGPVSPVPGRR